MGSKGRIPPPFSRHPHPGPGVVNPDPFWSNISPHPGSYPPFDMFPTVELIEQKLNAQHVEMQKLARENQKLATTHGSLRQQLATAQHEQKILHAQIEAVESERELQMKNLKEKIAKMESELKAAEPIKIELQQAHAEAQNLVAAREELVSRAHHLSQDLQRAHADLQQIPTLRSELESLRQEYQRCRATYDYEKKLYNNHLESLQAMEKNFMNMTKEVEKLRAQLTNATSADTNTGGSYSVTSGMNNNEVSGRPAAPNTVQNAYADSQGHTPLPGGISNAATAGPNAAIAASTLPYAAAPPGSAPIMSGYYGMQFQHGYDTQRGSVYSTQGGPVYDAQRASAYDMHRGPGYDPQSRGAVGSTGQVVASSNVSYASAMPFVPPGSGQVGPPQGSNPARK